MNRSDKYIVYGSLGLLLVIATISVGSCFKNDPLTYTNTMTIKEIRDDSITYWKDRFNREHAEKRLAEGTLEEIKLVYGPVMDSVLKSLKIQGDQLKQLTITGISSTNTVSLIVDTVFVDSSQAFHYKDQWIKLDGTFGKKNILTYTTFDSLIIAGYTKKTGFLGLGGRETFVNAWSINPHSKITGLQGVSIAKERAKRFGVGPYVGFGYNGAKWSPQIGIGINYSLIRF